MYNVQTCFLLKLPTFLSVNPQNEESALMVAVSKNAIEMVSLLLNAGADIDLLNKA